MKIMAVCDGDGVTQAEILPNSTTPPGWTTVTVSTPVPTTSTKVYCPKCFGKITFPVPAA